MKIRDLDFGCVASLTRAVAENGENDHHENGDEHDDDRDLQSKEKEADQHDKLFEQGHHNEN